MECNKEELAKHLGVSLPTVTAWIRKGCPHEYDGRTYKLVLKDVVDWRIKEKVAEALKRAHAEDPEVPTDGVESYDGAKRRREIALANLEELELDKRRGELVSRSEVETAAFNRARLERDALLNWPARVSSLIGAALTADAALVQITLDLYLREFLQQEPEASSPLLAA